jgi:hypothetical protein
MKKIFDTNRKFVRVDLRLNLEEVLADYVYGFTRGYVYEAEVFIFSARIKNKHGLCV